MESAKETLEAEVIDRPIATRDPLNNDSLVIPGKSDNEIMLEMFERLASNPDVDPSKMKQFLDMQEHVLDRNAQIEFNAAMVRAQGQMHTVLKNCQGERSRYANLEAVLVMARPIYTKEGFAVSFAEGFGTTEHPLKPGCIRMVADIMHQAGHTKTVTADVPLDDKGPQGQVNKTGTQATGSSFAYGRRYLNCMIWNIDTGDDNDGAGKSAQSQQPLSRAKKGQQARQTTQPENAPETTTEPPKKPQSKEGAEKREFANVCNVQASVFGVTKEGETLKPGDYKSLLAQAMQLAGTESIAEAGQWATQNVTNMVRDAAGVRFIS